MPRVPVIGGPSVSSRPIGTQNLQLDSRSGLRELAQGVEAVGATVQRAEQEEKAREEKARKEAKAREEKARKEARDWRRDRADLEFGKAVNTGLHDSQSGFLNQLGENAFDNKPTMDFFAKERERIAKSLPDEEERQGFHLRAESRTEQARARMEQHVAEQGLKVKAEISGGAANLAKETARLDPESAESAVDKALVGPKKGEAGPFRRYLLAQGLPFERVKEQEDEFRADTYRAALDSVLATQDWRRAEVLFEKWKPRLGPYAKHYEDRINLKRIDAESDAMATEAVAKSLDAKGRPDANRAAAYIDRPRRPDKGTINLNEPPGPVGSPELREAARKKAHARGVHAEGVWDQETKDITTRIGSAKNELGWANVPLEDKRLLNHRNPDKYASFERAWQNAKKERAGSKSDAIRAQKSRDRYVKEAFNNLSLEEKIGTTDINAFLANLPELDGPVSLEMRTHLGALRTWAERIVNNGDGAHMSEFVTAAQALKLGRGPTTKTEMRRFTAGATNKYYELYEKHKGRPPRTEFMIELPGLFEVGETKPRPIRALERIPFVGKGEEPDWERRAREIEEAAEKKKPGGAAPEGVAAPPKATDDKAARLEELRRKKAAGTLGSKP